MTSPFDFSLAIPPRVSPSSGNPAWRLRPATKSLLFLLGFNGAMWVGGLAAAEHTRSIVTYIVVWCWVYALLPFAVIAATLFVTQFFQRTGSSSTIPKAWPATSGWWLLAGSGVICGVSKLLTTHPYPAINWVCGVCSAAAFLLITIQYCQGRFFTATGQFILTFAVWLTVWFR